MSATNATTSQGSKLEVSVSSSFHEIIQIVGWTGPSIVTDMADITNLGSPTAFKEWLPILKDGGNVSFDMFYIPADTYHAYLRTANINGTLEAFKMTFVTSPAATISFSTYVTKFENKVQKGSPLMIGVELKVTGTI